MASNRFSDEEKKRISQAIQAAESRTSGEIVAAIVPESASYATQELLFAIGGGIVYFLILLFFVHDVENFLMSLFWDYRSAYLVMFYGCSTFILIFLLYLLCNVSFVDRLVLRKKTMILRVRERALRYFSEEDLGNTRDHTGVLLFISLLEQRVELLADRGIAQKVAPEKWQGMTAALTSKIRRGMLVDALCEAIAVIGLALQEHFPRDLADKNELSDEVRFLER